MTKKVIEKACEESSYYTTLHEDCIQSYYKNIRVLGDIKGRGFDPDFGVIESVNVAPKSVGFSFAASASKEDMAQVVRDFVRITGIALTKEPCNDRSSLLAIGQLTDVTIIFHNYIPPSCHVEEETIVVPEHTKITKKVVCTKNLEDTEKVDQEVAQREDEDHVDLGLPLSPPSRGEGTYL
jgi:hypothetical protein